MEKSPGIAVIARHRRDRVISPTDNLARDQISSALITRTMLLFSPRLRASVVKLTFPITANFSAFLSVLCGSRFFLIPAIPAIP
jgi:hypothetical protein